MRGLPLASVHDHRILRQAGVTFERVFDFFLGRRAGLPGDDLLLEQLGPGAVEVDLLVDAFVDDLETMP